MHFVYVKFYEIPFMGCVFRTHKLHFQIKSEVLLLTNVLHLCLTKIEQEMAIKNVAFPKFFQNILYLYFVLRHRDISKKR